jgi:hypothetical protein
MILEKQDTFYVAHKVMNYFKDFNRIDDYFRSRKIERVKNMPAGLPGMSIEDDLFQDFDMHPEDMDFEVVEVPGEVFNTLIEKTASFSPDENPGKTLKVVVKEKTTSTIVGFIRYGSPLINSKPRNDFLGGMPDLDIFNHRAIMGFNIVPAQPFGFNCLGGKLLAAIACSHLAKDILDKKYGGPFCMFETTSLYGTTKSVSQYDGMKPFLRHKGETVSDFAPLINDEKYRQLKSWFEDKMGEPLVDPEASSRKLKSQTKMISIIKASLKDVDEDAYNKFCQTFLDAKKLTEQKRSYLGDFGYSNVKEYLNMETDELQKKDNWDRYSFQGVCDWWSNKASKRYESLIDDGRTRTISETWNKNAEDIDIIR